MPFYEITLKATVTKVVCIQGNDFDDAVSRAKDRFPRLLEAEDETTLCRGSRLDPEVEQHLVLDDDEVVRLRQAGHAI